MMELEFVCVCPPLQAVFKRVPSCLWHFSVISGDQVEVPGVPHFTGRWKLWSTGHLWQKASWVARAKSGDDTDHGGGKNLAAKKQNKTIQDVEIDWYRGINYMFLIDFGGFFGGGDGARALFSMYTWFFGDNARHDSIEESWHLSQLMASYCMNSTLLLLVHG